jgi:tripartite-type tricarboxylate transporter receptor subunit TctC
LPLALPCCPRCRASRERNLTHHAPYVSSSDFQQAELTDLAARLIAQWLSERLGQQFIVENRPGAGGTIATEVAVRAAGDGNTLLVVTSENPVNQYFYKLSFNTATDIKMVAGILRSPLVLAVHPTPPVHTVQELIARAQQNVGKMTMASNGLGTVSHLAGELFKSKYPPAKPGALRCEPLKAAYPGGFGVCPIYSVEWRIKCRSSPS